MLRCTLVTSTLLAGIAAATPQDPEVKPLPRADLQLSVFDFETDRPIHDAHAVARQWPGDLEVEGRSDEVGRVRLAGLEIGKPTQVVIQHKDHAARRLSIALFAGGHTQVYLLPARILRGTIHARGGPVEEFTLRAAPGSETVMAIEDESYTLPVRADGSFGPVKIGAGEYVLRTMHPVRPERWEWLLDTKELDTRLDLTLDGGPGTIRGRVLDEAGNPRVGTPVRLRRKDNTLGSAWRSVETDDSGLYVFHEVPWGDWVIQPLRATDRNFFDAESLVLHTRSRTASWGIKNVSLIEGTATLDARFGYDVNAVNVTGVLRAAQVPVSGWRVRIEDEDTGDMWMSDFTRPDGMFEIPGLDPKTEYRITFVTPHTQIHGGSLRTGTAEREVHWIDVPPGRLTGQVFVEGTKFSPEEGEIVITAVGGDEREFAWATLAADGTFDVPGLQPGRHQVHFRAPSFRTATETFAIDAADALEVDLILWTTLVDR